MGHNWPQRLIRPDVADGSFATVATERQARPMSAMPPADRHELHLMAAAAAVYDKTKLASGQTALISYGFVLGYFKLNGEPLA